MRWLLDRRASEREGLERRLAQLEAEHAHQQAELRERKHLISGAITTAQRAAAVAEGRARISAGGGG